jgi:hypothetical protein
MATYVIRQSEIQRFVMILAGDKISTLSEPEKIRMDVPRWPWGNHHTELLGQLNAAASRWWVNRDPDDNTTAPTNEEVSAWLQQRGVSKRSADALATILRADGLPTGPRT